jgi:hypothetical protein
MQAFCFSSLWSIVVSASVERREEQCFAHCDELSSVRFEAHSQLAIVAQNAFRDCRALKTIWIPSSLRTIVAKPLECCPGVHIVIIETASIVHHAGELRSAEHEE